MLGLLSFPQGGSLGFVEATNLLPNPYITYPLITAKIINYSQVCTAPRVMSGSICTLPPNTPDPKKNLADSCNAVGDPCNAGTGNKYQHEPDYTGIGLYPLHAERIYNSGPAESANLGSNWRGSYDRSIEFVTNGVISTTTVKRADGKQYYYNLMSGAWVGDVDVAGTLVQLFDTTVTPAVPAGWTYTNADDEVERYDAIGKLVSITNRAGLSQTLTYSCTVVSAGCPVVTPVAIAPAAGLLLSVTDPAGRQLNFSYDSVSRVFKMTDPAGGIYTYKYSGPAATDNLISVTYPDGKVRSYLYGEAANVSASPAAGVSYAHALTGLTDEDGNRYATWMYDAQDRVISSENGVGIDKVTLIYNTDGTTSVVDSIGANRVYGYATLVGVVKNTNLTQSCTACGSSSAATTYDANGNVASRTDFNGNVTTYSYDLTRNLETSRTEAAGTPLARTITTSWHPSFRLPTQITEPGRVTTLAYDATTGNRLSQRITDSASNTTRTWTYTYTTSADGTLLALLKTADGPRTDVADVTAYAYYPNGDLKSVTDALGHITQITQYDANGRPLTVVDPNGVVGTLTYTPRGWLQTRTVAGRTTRNDYDGAGQVIKITLPDSSTLTYTYDAAHRLTDITDRLLNRVHYTLDALGNRVKEDVFDASNTLTTTHSRVFDALNRLWKDIGALNQTTLYAYDANGNLTGITDPLARTTVNNYDALNRLTQVTDALTGITRYGYDPLDQLRSLTDPRNLTTGYSVNALGDQPQQTSPDTGTTNRSFDAAGNLKTRTDARGVTATLSYDALNRLTQVSYPTPGENLGYTWDAAAGCSNGVGRLCQVSDSDGVTTFSYDPWGHLIQAARVSGGVSYVTGYAYDAADRLSTETTPTGENISLARNSAGQVSQVTATVGATTTLLAQNLHYNGAGQVTAQTLGNGVTQTASFDLSGQASGQSYTPPPPPDNNDTPTLPQWGAILMGGLLLGLAYRRRIRPHRLAQLAWLGLVVVCLQGWPVTSAWADNATLQYDAAGNVQQRTTPLGATTYTYDALDRLKSEAGPAKIQSFSYDANSNRLSDGAGSYTYPAASNRMQTRRGAAVTTDAAGHITNDGSGRNYVYNQAGRLAQVLQGTTLVASYTYNYQGQRSRKVTTGAAPQGVQTVVYHYDVQGHLIAETSANGTPLRTYVWRDEVPVAQIEYSPARHVLYFDVDHLNTPRAARDASGKIVWQWESDAFGATLANEDPSSSGVKTTVNLRLPGQYFDQETSLHYNYFRDYDPGTGRYVESDPIGLDGGINTYGYANQNPLKFTDPEGLDPFGSGSSTGSRGFTPAPTPFDVFTPGTSANNTFVQSVYQMAHAVKNLCSSDETEKECEAQYDRDMAECRTYSKMAGDKYTYIACKKSAESRLSKCMSGK
jgi:RHS repeat-associated protein